MKEINIIEAIDKMLIFDDPYDCQGLRSCPRLLCHHHPDYAKCSLFLDNDNKKIILNIHGVTGFYQKCDQCKTAYQKTKDNEALKIAEEAVAQQELDILLGNGFIELSDEE